MRLIKGVLLLELLQSECVCVCEVREQEDDGINHLIWSVEMETYIIIVGKWRILAPTTYWLSYHHLLSISTDKHMYFLLYISSHYPTYSQFLDSPFLPLNLYSPFILSFALMHQVYAMSWVTWVLTCISSYKNFVWKYRFFFYDM